MIASSVTVGHGAESYIWIRLLQRPPCPISAVPREFVVRPTVGLPSTFFESIVWFPRQSWDDHVCDSSIASSGEIPDGASESR